MRREDKEKLLKDKEMTDRAYIEYWKRLRTWENDKQLRVKEVGKLVAAEVTKREEIKKKKKDFIANSEKVREITNMIIDYKTSIKKMELAIKISTGSLLSYKKEAGKNYDKIEKFDDKQIKYLQRKITKIYNESYPG